LAESPSAPENADEQNQNALFVLRCSCCIGVFKQWPYGRKKSEPALPDQRVTLPTPVALPPMDVPTDNPMTPEKAGLVSSSSSISGFENRKHVLRNLSSA